MRSLLVLGLAVVLSACEPAAVAPPPATPAQAMPKAATSTTDAAMTLEKAPEYGKVDKVGTNDGALQPDGAEDLVFTATVDGPIAVLFLVSVDEHGIPTGQFQADTLIEGQQRPEELGLMCGSATSSLGVFEGGKPLNAPDGTLPALPGAKRRLTLYTAKLDVQSGTRLRLYVLRPDQSLVGGAPLTI